MKKKYLLTLLSCCLLSAAGNAQQQLASQLLGIKNVDTSVSEAPPRLAAPSEATPTFTVVKPDGVLGKLADGKFSEGALQRAAVRKAAKKASAPGQIGVKDLQTVLNLLHHAITETDFA